jgi:hypothetical protein
MTLNDFAKVWKSALTNTYITDLKGNNIFFDGNVHQLKKSDINMSMEILEINLMDDCLYISVNEEI